VAGDAYDVLRDFPARYVLGISAHEALPDPVRDYAQIPAGLTEIALPGKLTALVWTDGIHCAAYLQGAATEVLCLFSGAFDTARLPQFFLNAPILFCAGMPPESMPSAVREVYISAESRDAPARTGYILRRGMAQTLAMTGGGADCTMTLRR
jgi:hypothetical protein